MIETPLLDCVSRAVESTKNKKLHTNEQKMCKNGMNRIEDREIYALDGAHMTKYNKMEMMTREAAIKRLLYYCLYSTSSELKMK